MQNGKSFYCTYIDQHFDSFMENLLTFILVITLSFTFYYGFTHQILSPHRSCGPVRGAKGFLIGRVVQKDPLPVNEDIHGDIKGTLHLHHQLILSRQLSDDTKLFHTRPNKKPAWIKANIFYIQ